MSDPTKPYEAMSSEWNHETGVVTITVKDAKIVPQGTKITVDPADWRQVDDARTLSEILGAIPGWCIARLPQERAA